MSNINNKEDRNVNDFAVLSDFPNNAKAIGPCFSVNMYYSFTKESYFTFDCLLDNDDLCEGVHVNQNVDRECAIGMPLFVVSTVNEDGKLVKLDENAFYQSILNGSSGLENHIIMEPKTIIEKFSALKELAIKKLGKSVNAYGCDAFWPTCILYCFDEASKTIGYEITGNGFVIHSNPNFEDQPKLIKISYGI